MNEQNYSLSMKVKSNHLSVYARGIRTRATVYAITMEVFEKARAEEQSRVLIDVKNLEGALGVLDSFFLVTEVFQKIRGKAIRQAAIVDEHQSYLRGRFLETVAVNRGFNLKIFSNHEDAEAWIES